MGYRLTRPLFFGDDRLPSVRIGTGITGGIVSCDLTFSGRDHTLWRLRITVPGRTVYDEREAVRQPVRDYGRGRQAAEVLSSSISFLLADAEAYRATMGRRTPCDGWVFTAAVAEWAYLNDTELQAMADQLADDTTAGGRADEIVDYFRVYRTDPEAVFTVDPLDADQPPLTIGIATLGGGTVGQAYADNDWIYAVHLDGRLVTSGTDLHSGGVAQTHRQMAAALTAALGDGDAAPAALADQAERLSVWASDIEEQDADEEDHIDVR
ncbi:hypothetical protein [Asanoa iriomotensis]|uniref:Uncharacterized protein n=1 Tax=Asanoa iriomotensis TaxID=234613 RepID=A0ABQ4C947_9ACTN|nr:hypothetical protein [Asanoa iriomotensis]GIF59277.1 hypothetical protein Air01nite_53720 [Asanoa iriomotensis]